MASKLLLHQTARCLPLLCGSVELGIRGARDSGDGGCGAEDAEAVWRCRWYGLLDIWIGDSGRGSMPRGS